MTFFNINAAVLLGLDSKPEEGMDICKCIVPVQNGETLSSHRAATPPELWFRQDGATCHTARATIDLLKDTFGDRLISRFGPVNRPPRSCDFTPLDYFM
ncbi:DUF4817 domain-containing protein [Trichonephila clavipes]|nr:DUF4817 domain-containing protein [Trichonephila clavipes]